MYYRRKILLSLLEIFGGELEGIRLQKLLMLLSRSQEKPSFDFVPHTQGCFSFRANADLKTLSKYKQVIEQNGFWKKVEKESYITELKQKDRQALVEMKDRYEHKSLEDIVITINESYPFYAMNTTSPYGTINSTEPETGYNNETEANRNKLFTIGYEGISLESYLNKLIRNDVKSLLDVRKNSVSMKYGFSKRQLQEACHGINIMYYHLPELGIESNKRKKLESQADYNLLFKEYERVNLPNTIKVQEQVLNLVDKYQRVALTCFEADVCQCHRKPLAESISRLSNSPCEVEHI